MTAIPMYPCVTSTAAVGSAAGAAAFLRLENRRLTAGQVVLVLACYLAEFDDNIHGEVDPAHAITPGSATAISTAGSRSAHPRTSRQS